MRTSTAMPWLWKPRNWTSETVCVQSKMKERKVLTKPDEKETALKVNRILSFSDHEGEADEERPKSKAEAHLLVCRSCFPRDSCWACQDSLWEKLDSNEAPVTPKRKRSKRSKAKSSSAKRKTLNSSPLSKQDHREKGGDHTTQSKQDHQEKGGDHATQSKQDHQEKEGSQATQSKQDHSAEGSSDSDGLREVLYLARIAS